MLLHQTLLPFLCFSVSSFIERISFSEIETKREAILFLFGCSEVNSTWIITSGLANQRAPKALFTCVVYTNHYYYTSLPVGVTLSSIHIFSHFTKPDALSSFPFPSPSSDLNSLSRSVR